MSKICMGCMSEYDDEFEICPICGYAEGTQVEEALHMEPGSILRERYIVGKVLGFGGFGVTYIGWDALLEQKVAIKEYLPSEFSTRIPGQSRVTVFNGDKQEQFRDGLSKFVEEAQRLVKFQSEEGIVKVFDSFEDNNTAYIIMEYLNGETLAEYLKREKTVAADKAIEMIMPVIKSLQNVHEQGIIHRDIAPDNIFLTNDGKVKLIDFGSARFATTSHSRSLTVIIKPGFSPEEQYRSRGDQGAHTDVYAIGATLYRMVTGTTPPDALERRAFFESKKKDILRPITKFTKDITVNQETAILNALNVRIEDRTQDMATLEKELLTEEPDRVVRLYGKIKRIDVLKWPIWAKITASAAMLTVVVLSVLFATGVIGFDSLLQTEIKVPEGMSRVPSVINDELGKAENRLDKAELLYMISGKTYSNLVPEDLILTQSISAGLVVINNTVVDVSISGGAETKTVPNVVGLSSEEATKAFEELGIAVRIEKEYSSLIAENCVISQDKEPESELAVGELVTLIVSMGRDPAEQGGETMAKVPEFVGLKYQEALKKAQETGFVISVKKKEYSTKYEKNVVMAQGVEAGTEIVTGNTIELVVSLGVQSGKVPDVQFKTESTAREMIVQSGFTAAVTYQSSETVASGLVISQNPAAETSMESGKTVDIIVSSGGVAFAMPNVVGKTEADARSVLSGKGLSVLVEYEKSASVLEGKVIRQSVAANTSVNRGKGVTITVSSGKELIKVENVVGKKQSSAADMLKGQGFEVTVVEIHSESTAKDIVISQTPSAGSSQTKGTRIVINVSKGKEPIKVQNMTNKTLAAAKNTLESLGFVISTSEEYSDASPYVPAGSVISQSPSGGTAFRGDMIALVVSKGRTPVTLPNVVNQSKSTAENTLKGAGLKVNFAAEIYHATVKAGNVISQSPAYGANIYKGDTITLTVSKGPDPDAYTISLNKNSISMQEDGTEQLVVAYTPAGTAAKTIQWTSSDAAVAAVSSSGLVTAKAQGSATITAAAPNGTKASAVITVVQLPRYTIAFNANGGTGSAPSQTVKSGSSATLPVVTKKFEITYNAAGGTLSGAGNKTAACPLNGWYTAATGGSKRGNAGASYKPTVSETLYAQWGSATYGTLPVPTRTNYSFDGWYTASSGGTKVSATSSVTTNVTIYAHWKGNEYTLTFNANGGSVSPTSKTIAYGDSYGTLPTPVRENYTFDGWYTAVSGGTKVTTSTKVTVVSNQTLYAHWTAKKFMLTYNANGGTVSTASKTLTYGDSYGTLPTPTRDYYVFDGWYTAASGGSKVSASTLPDKAADVTIYAHWTAKNPSDWVKASAVPAGAKITERKWTYTLRSYTTSGSSSMSGWTKYDTKRTAWGGTQGPVYSDPSNGARNVWSESYETGRTHHWVYYRWQNPSNNQGSDIQTSSYRNYQEIDLTYQLTEKGSMGNYAQGYRYYYSGSSYNSYWYKSEYDDISYGTRWYYQEPVYTYYYYKDENKESSSSPSGSDISNIQEWVRYIAK